MLTPFQTSSIGVPIHCGLRRCQGIRARGRKMLDLSGNFWGNAAHALPTQGVVDSLASASATSEAIPQAVTRES